MIYLDSPRRLRIAFCVMNWGLGHATRSSVIIEQLVEQGHEITIFSDGQALKWLDDNFELETCALPSYGIEYPSSGRGLIRSLLLKALKFNYKEEQKVLLDIHRKRHFDLIISDNRYGCFIEGVKSIIITHQTHPIIPFVPARLVGLMHRRFLKKFQEIWIVDDENHSYAGKLSQAFKQNEPKQRIIGPLSRFKEGIEVNKDIDILIVLSGPKGSKQDFLMRLKSALSKLKNYNIVLIGAEPTDLKSEGITIFETMGTEELKGFLDRAKIVVSRSGYSSIMDYQSFSFRRIWVPTPEQTEQAYLAELRIRKGDLLVKQSDLGDLHRLVELELK